MDFHDTFSEKGHSLLHTVKSVLILLNLKKDCLHEMKVAQIFPDVQYMQQCVKDMYKLPMH